MLRSSACLAWALGWLLAAYVLCFVPSYQLPVGNLRFRLAIYLYLPGPGSWFSGWLSGGWLGWAMGEKGGAAGASSVRRSRRCVRRCINERALGPPEDIGRKILLRILEFSMWILFSIDLTRLKTRNKVVFGSILVKFWNLPWANIFKRTQDSTKKCLSSNCD